MKHLLYGTTALVAAGLVLGSATAKADDKPIQITIGGYMYQFFVISQHDAQDGATGGTNAASLGGGLGTGSTLANRTFKDKARLQFDGRTQLDNGLVAGLRVQLRGSTGANTATGGQATEDQIDEHFAFLDSATYGRMEAGATASVARKMWYGAVTPAMPVHGLMSPNFLESANNFQPSTLISFGGNTDRAQKAAYYTPRIAGFQLGVSYAPDTCDMGDSSPAIGGGTTIPVCNFNDGTHLKNVQGQRRNIWGGALNYVNKFGDFDVGIYAGFETATVQPINIALTATQVQPVKNDQTQAGTGFRVSWNGWTGGISYRYDTLGVTAANLTNAGQALVGNAKNRNDAHIGLAYGQGPWSVGASMAWMRETRVGGIGQTLGHDRGLWEAVGANYTLGPGISINAAVERADVTGGLTVGTAAVNGSTGFPTGTLSDHAWIYTVGTVMNF